MGFWLIAALLFVPIPQSPHPSDAVFERFAKVGVLAFGSVGYAAVSFEPLISGSASFLDAKRITSEWPVTRDTSRLSVHLSLANFCRGLRNLPYMFIEQDQVVRELDLARFLGRKCEIVRLTRRDRK